MNNQLKIVLECYSINPIVEQNKKVSWLNKEYSILELGSNVHYLMIRIKKIKIHFEKNSNLQLQFPFNENDFMLFAKHLSLELSQTSSWIKDIHYELNYSIVPLLITPNEIFIGIMIDESTLEQVLQPNDILESNIYLSKINNQKTITTNKDTKFDTKVDATVDTKIDTKFEIKYNIFSGLLEFKNNFSKRMRYYIMNCKNYIMPIRVQRITNKNSTKDFFQNHLNP